MNVLNTLKLIAIMCEMPYVMGLWLFLMSLQQSNVLTFQTKALGTQQFFYLLSKLGIVTYANVRGCKPIHALVFISIV